MAKLHEVISGGGCRPRTCRQSGLFFGFKIENDKNGSILPENLSWECSAIHIPSCYAPGQMQLKEYIKFQSKINNVSLWDLSRMFTLTWKGKPKTNVVYSHECCIMTAQEKNAPFHLKMQGCILSKNFDKFTRRNKTESAKVSCTHFKSCRVKSFQVSALAQISWHEICQWIQKTLYQEIDHLTWSSGCRQALADFVTWDNLQSFIVWIKFNLTKKEWHSNSICTKIFQQWKQCFSYDYLNNCWKHNVKL